MGSQLLRIHEAIHNGAELFDDEEDLRRLASLGMLTGGATHDLSNSLFALLGYLRLAIAEAPADAKERRFLERAQDAAEKSADIVEQLALFQQVCGPTESRVDLIKVVTGAGKLLKSGLSEDGVEKELNQDFELDSVYVDMNSSLIRRVVLDIAALAFRLVKSEGANVSLLLRGEEITAGNETPAGALPPGRYASFETRVELRGGTESSSPREFPPLDSGEVGAGGIYRALGPAESLLKEAGGALFVDESKPGEIVIRMSVPVVEAPNAECGIGRESSGM